MNETPPPQPRRRLKPAASASLLILALAAAILWAALPGLAGRAVRAELAKLGWPEARIGEITASWNRLEAREIALDEGGFSRIGRLSATYQPWEALFGGRLLGLMVENPELTLDVEESGILSVASGDISGNRAARLPARLVTISGAKIDILTGIGALRITGSFQAREDRAGLPHISLQLVADQQQLSFALNAQGRVRADGTGEFDIHLEGGRLETAHLSFSRLQGSARILWNSQESRPEFTLELAAGSLEMFGLGMQDLDMAGGYENQYPHFEARMRAGGYDSLILEAAAPYQDIPGSVRFRLTGERLKDLKLYLKNSGYYADIIPEKMDGFSYEALLFSDESPDCRLTLRTPEGEADIGAVFEPSYSDILVKEIDINPSSVIKFFMLSGAPDLSLPEGSIRLAAPFRIAPGEKGPRLDGPARLVFSGLAGEMNGLAFEQGHGDIALLSLTPPEISPLTLAFKRASFGIDARDVRLSFGARGKNAPWLEAGGRAAGGRFRITSRQQDGRRFLLDLRDIDLAEISALAKVNGLEMKGRLSGTLPLAASRDGAVRITGGALSGAKGGYVRYVPDSFPPALSGASAQMETVRKALEDFQLHAMRVDIEGDLEDSLQARLEARGRNPAFGERPIHLHLNLEGAVGPLIRQTLHLGWLEAIVRP